MKLGEKQQQWVDALRSGKYEQTKRRLKGNSGHCCLGVACQEFKDELDLEETTDGETYSFNGMPQELPSIVKNHLGLLTANGSVVSYRECLSSMNDNGKTFDEIADFIEEHTNQLFTASK